MYRNIAGIGQAVLELLSFKSRLRESPKGNLLQKFSEIFGNIEDSSQKFSEIFTENDVTSDNSQFPNIKNCDIF